MNPEDREDQFQVWVIHMDDAIDELRQVLPHDVNSKLDFSPDSLDVIEQWLLKKYSSKEDLTRASEDIFFDGSARYLGETFRKNIGGRWFSNSTDRSRLFYGIPQLVDMRGQEVPFSPLTTVTACFSRRTGSYFRNILLNLKKKAGE